MSFACHWRMEFIHLYVQQPMPSDMPDQRELLKRRQWRIMFVEARKTQCEEVGQHLGQPQWLVHHTSTRARAQSDFLTSSAADSSILIPRRSTNSVISFAVNVCKFCLRVCCIKGNGEENSLMTMPSCAKRVAT